MNRLAHESIGAEGAAGRATLYVLHGFLGSGRNWASFARRLVELRSDWRVVLVDLRLHGDSQNVAGPHTVGAAADDVADLARGADGPAGPIAMLGHSFGGKVALAVTERLSPAPVQTWIIDSTPAPGGEDGAAARILSRLEASPASFTDREAAVAWIAAGGIDVATARWMATNLERGSDGWTWRLDAAGLRDLLADFVATDLWHVLESPPRGASIHLVRASAGSILSADDAERIDGLAARGEPVALHELEGGHLLHIDNPEGLLELVAGVLPRLAPPTRLP